MPGDRRSNCGSRMQPIGLTLKNVVTNPFTGRTSGELMIVHRCMRCERVSHNRIAGDDYPDAIIELLSTADQCNHNLLTKSDTETVLIALFGYNYAQYWKK